MHGAMGQSVICEICDLYVRTRTYILRGEPRYADSSMCAAVLPCCRAVLHATGDDPMRDFTRAALEGWTCEVLPNVD